MYMSDEDELEIYHAFCDISNMCREYFWLRLHMPKDGWSIDGEVGGMLSNLYYLKDTFEKLKAKYPEEEEEWDTDQM